jgi:hypothetical protein
MYTENFVTSVTDVSFPLQMILNSCFTETTDVYSVAQKKNNFLKPMTKMIG